MEIESYSHVFTDKAELDGYVFGKKDNQWYFTEYIGENDALILPDDFNGNHYEIYNNAKIKKTITSLDTGNGITDLPGLLFLNFSNLEEVTIGEKLQTAGVGVFAGCYNLRTLNYNVVHFENQRAAYYMEYVDEKGYRNSTYYPLEFKSILTLNIGNDVECLPKNAFQGNKNLTSIALPNSIKTVNEFDFQYCTGLQEINLESVKTIGEKAFYGSTGLKEINLESVETIENSAFYGCTGLTELTLGKKLTSVGVGAFAGCYNLQTLNYNVMHFENPRTDNDVNYYDENGNRKYTYYPLEFNSISTLNIGDEVEYIPNNTVRENKNLTTVNLADGIKAQSIGKYTFYGCSNLQSINLYKEPKKIETDEKEENNGEEDNNEENNEEDNEETKEVLMTKGVCIKNIGEYAFYGCTGIKEINLESVETIGEKAFYGCTGLYKINLKSVTIENYAFHGCTGLKEINLENVKTIGTSAFNGCTGLTELTLDKKLTSIGVGAFAGCYNLRTLNYNVVHFENPMADNYVWYYDENGISKVTYYPFEFNSISTLNIGNDVEYIPNNMVRGNNNLTTVNLADGIKAQTIGESTFSSCSNLQSINLYEEPKKIVAEENGENCEEETDNEENSEEKNEGTKEVLMTKGVCIKNIGSSAFYGCTGLQEINLENVETIGSSAFYGCTGLTELTLEKNLTSIGVGAFAGCYNLQTLNYNVVHFENQKADNYVSYYDYEKGYNRSTYYPLEFNSISTLNIGDDVEYIPNNMVQENKNLTTVNLADGIKAQTIGKYTFSGCSNLLSINLYEEPREIVTDEEENSDEETNDEENGEEENEGTKEVLMTKGVCIKNIGEYAFSSCPKLNNYLDLRGVETIGNYAFSSTQISNLTLGKNLNSVADYAFSFNAPLEKLTVSNDYGLNYMLGKEYYDYTDYRYKKVIKKLVIAEDFADEQITGNFTNQNNLETIESNTVEPLAFALANPFTESQYSSIAVKVPEESAEKYKAVPVWKLFYVTSADCLLKLYNGNSEMQLIPQDGTERPQEATAVNAVMLIDEQLEAGNGLLTMGNVVYRNERNNWVAGEINLSDAKPFYNPVDAVAQTINYVRNFTSTNLQALYLPYAMSYDDWKDKAKVSYINDVHQFDDDDDGEIDRTVLEFISVKSGELAPNIPYLIKPLEKGETTFTSSNKTLKATLSDGYIDCSSTRMLYTLKGTYQTRDDIYANGYYAMSGGTFKVADNAGVKLSPFRIFLSITNRYGSGAVPRAKKITIMVDGVEEEMTDINDIMMSDAQPTEIYNLQGVRVDEGYKGIVIRNGRKVLVK